MSDRLTRHAQPGESVFTNDDPALGEAQRSGIVLWEHNDVDMGTGENTVVYHCVRERMRKVVWSQVPAIDVIEVQPLNRRSIRSLIRAACREVADGKGALTDYDMRLVGLAGALVGMLKEEGQHG